MNDSEWRSKLGAAHARVASRIRDEIAAMIETKILYALQGAENEYVLVCRELLDSLNAACEQLLIDSQAEPNSASAVTFDVLKEEVRGEEWKDSGLENARSERDEARRYAAGLNLEILTRAWLEWRLKASLDAL